MQWQQFQLTTLKTATRYLGFRFGVVVGDVVAVGFTGFPALMAVIVMVLLSEVE